MKKEYFSMEASFAVHFQQCQEPLDILIPQMHLDLCNPVANFWYGCSVWDAKLPKIVINGFVNGMFFVEFANITGIDCNLFLAFIHDLHCTNGLSIICTLKWFHSEIYILYRVLCTCICSLACGHNACHFAGGIFGCNFVNKKVLNFNYNFTEICS